MSDENHVENQAVGTSQKSEEASSDVEKRKPSSIQVEADELATAIVAVVNSFNSGPLAEKSRVYPNAFDIGEDNIKLINKRALEVLSDESLNWFPNSTVTFRASVGMPDLTRREFSDFDKFMSRGGDNNNLERLELLWLRRIGSPFAAEVSVSVAFITERKLDLGELGLFNYHVSSMNLRIAGHTDEFVEKIFKLFDPIMEASKISIFYAPLLMFRSKEIVHIFSNTIAIAAMLVGQVKIFDYLRISEKLNKNKILDTISQNQDISQKINILAKELLAPEESPWWYVVVALGFGAAGYAIMLTLLMKLLPMLVPRSLINIGLSKSFNDKYQNVYKLVVVTVIFGMIVTPIAKKLLDYILQ